MKRPYIIAINAVSGGGKTALSKLVHECLASSAVFYFDDFDSTNVYPDDFYQWWKRGANLTEFDCPGMGRAVDEEIQRGEMEFIVMDYPFGRDHPRFQDVIDFSVYIDTPFDVAMARRVIRDYKAIGDEDPAIGFERLLRELGDYLQQGRHVYLDTERHKPNSDLILDGSLTLNELKDQLLAHMYTKKIDKRQQ